MLKIIIFVEYKFKTTIMKKIYFLLLSILMTSVSFAQVIITELADPNNDASARYVEIYNAGATGFDLTGYELRRWTNATATPQVTGIDLTPIGTLAAGQFATIAANQTAFTAAYGFAATLEGGTGGAVDSNGDDQVAILDASDAIVDIFGVPGEDGSLTCHEFEDGRAERKAGITMPVATWDESEWNVWADSAVTGCTSHTQAPQDSPGAFDPGAWIGTATGPTITVGADVTGLDYFEGNGPSAEQSFSVEGVNLTTNITVTPPTNFEISTTSGSGFSTSPIVLTETGGSVSATVIYVQLAAGLTANTYNGNATITSGALAEMVNLDGTVSPAVPQFSVFGTPGDLNYGVGTGPSNVESISVEGLFLTNGITVTAPANFEVSLSSMGTFTPSVTVPQSSGTVANTDVFIRLASGLPVNSYSGDIIVSSSPAANQTVTLTGNVFGAATNALVLVGVYDGPLTGGIPKGIELVALADIPDLSVFGISSVTNGAGSSAGTVEYNFPADAVSAGDRIFLATEATEFANFFGFAPTYTNGVVGINGDDAIELYEGTTIIDTFGDVDMDGSGEAWDYLDGWAYRVSNTGPDGGFVVGNWTYSGINVFDGETTNATAATPYPIDVYTNTLLSTEDFTSTNFSIYPNPTSTGFVNITTTSNAAVNVTVFDILGKQVLFQTINNRLDVSNLKTGVYILQLNQDGATTTKKLVIK